MRTAERWRPYFDSGIYPVLAHPGYSRVRTAQLTAQAPTDPFRWGSFMPSQPPQRPGRPGPYTRPAQTKKRPLEAHTASRGRFVVSVSLFRRHVWPHSGPVAAFLCCPSVAILPTHKNGATGRHGAVSGYRRPVSARRNVPRPRHTRRTRGPRTQ